MTSPDPYAIEEHLLDENMYREKNGLTPFQYFVPYRFLQQRIAPRVPEEEPGEEQVPMSEEQSEAYSNNALRSALKRYIFIKAHGKELESLLTDRDKQPIYYNLWYYRDRNRQKVTASDDMMERFIEACCDRRIRFEVWPAMDNLEENDEVVLNTTQFKGYKAHVLKVENGKNGRTLTVALNLFQGAMLLKLPHLRMQDVLFNSRDSAPSSRESNRYKLIEDTQRKLFAIMEHRWMGIPSETIIKRDMATLDLLFTYRYLFLPTPAMRRKFKALMLICASMRGDRRETDLLVRQTERELQEMDAQPAAKSAVELRAFLQAALFIATHNPDYRAAALSYLESRPKPTATHLQLLRWLNH